MKFSSRMYDVLESLQYGGLYMGAAFLGGVGLDFAFPRFNEKTDIKRLILEVVGQCLALVILVYFMRTIIRRVPFFFHIHKGSGFTPYMTHEYEGEMMMGLVFLGVQLNLVHKLDKLARELYEYLFQEKRDLIDDINVLRKKRIDG